MFGDLVVDAFPDDPSEWLDSDGDGYGDNKDAYPFDPERAGDLDGDGFVDNDDALPEDPAASKDSDGDGAPDAWNDGYCRRFDDGTLFR